MGISKSNDAGAATGQQAPHFADMQLAVGTRMQLLGTGRTPAAPAFTSLIGYIRHEYLLLQLPREKGGMTVSYSVGQEMMVRVFSGTSVFTFPARVERVLLAPLFQLYLTFPDTLDSTALRAGVRVKVEMPATVKVSGAADSDAPVAAVITNLSRNGALIDADRVLGNPDEKLSVAFEFKHDMADAPVRIETDATVRSMHKRTSATATLPARYEHGVQLSLESGQQLILQNYIYEMLIADRQKIA